MTVHGDYDDDRCDDNDDYDSEFIVKIVYILP
jgi:hypothetical protein